MTFLIPSFTSLEASAPRGPRYDGQAMSLAQFEQWEPLQRDGFKYEWNNGRLEAEASLKLSETKIYRNMTRAFATTESYSRGWEMIGEVELYLACVNRVRRPDLCVLRLDQIDNPSPSGTVVPVFVAEIISPFNTVLQIERKTRDYFRAGVRVVWHIYPNLGEVRVWTSPKDIDVCSDMDLCNAQPAVSDFQMKARTVFR